MYGHDWRPLGGPRPSRAWMPGQGELRLEFTEEMEQVSRTKSHSARRRPQTPTRAFSLLKVVVLLYNILSGQVLMEEDRFMVCCLDTVEECNDYGHPFNTDGWTGVRVAEMVRGNTDNRYLTMLTLPTPGVPHHPQPGH